MRSLLSSLALLVALTGSAAAQVTFQGLGYLPGGREESWARAVSADGSVVVGWSDIADGRYEAFRWTPTTGLLGLGSMPSGDNLQSNAYGVSADGSVIVGHAGGRAFRWTEATGMMALEHQAGTQEFANAVSEDGSVVVGNRAMSALQVEAARWSPSFDGLGFLSDQSPFYSDASAVSGDGQIVVGRSTAPLGGEAFRWTAATGMQSLGQQPGGGHNSTANAITTDGVTIIGVYSGGVTEAFRWTEATGMIGLGFLDPTNPRSEAFGVSADGSVIVGNSHTSPSIDEAFIWDEVLGMRNLKTLLVQGGADLTGWTILQVSGVSADGRTLIGIGRREDPSRLIREAWVATIPEPSGQALMFAAVAAAIALRSIAARRQSQSARPAA